MDAADYLIGENLDKLLCKQLSEVAHTREQQLKKSSDLVDGDDLYLIESSSGQIEREMKCPSCIRKKREEK